MIVAPNQKIVTCHTWGGGVVPEGFQPYYVNSRSVMSKAAHLLTPNAMLVYLYLSGNQDGYIMGLSSVAVCDWTGISRASYHRAINELTSKRFLCQNENAGNIVDFYLLPDNDFSSLDLSQSETMVSQSETVPSQSETVPSQVDTVPSQSETVPSQSEYRNNLYNLYNTLSDNPIHNLNDSLSDDLIGNTSSQEDNILTSSQESIISVAKKEEIDIGDCKYSFVDLVNAMRLIYRYDYDGAVERVKATFEPDQRHEEKWKALNFTSPEGLERAVERGRVKFADEAQPP